MVAGALFFGKILPNGDKFVRIKYRFIGSPDKSSRLRLRIFRACLPAGRDDDKENNLIIIWQKEKEIQKLKCLA